MEQPEVPTEGLMEHTHHEAEHGSQKWIMWVALSTAILAGFAAVASMMAGHTENEAMILQMKASDQWSYYQAKSLKYNMLKARFEDRATDGKPLDSTVKDKLADYEKEMKEIEVKARAFEGDSEHLLSVHVKFAYAVTFFQVAIALAAIAALSKSKPFWFFSMLLGAVGIAFSGIGGSKLLHEEHEAKQEQHEEKHEEKKSGEKSGASEKSGEHGAEKSAEKSAAGHAEKTE